jgi:hypothetical protein
MARRVAATREMKFMAKNIPQPGMGVAEAVLAVDFKDVARPVHRHGDDIANFSWPVGHHHDAVG